MTNRAYETFVSPDGQNEQKVGSPTTRARLIFEGWTLKPTGKTAAAAATPAPTAKTTTAKNTEK